MIYEFITPSDPITFLANNDKIAIAASIIMGEGKAGCNDENGKSIPTMYLFHPDPLPEIEKDLELPFSDFIELNKKEISECLLSFSYTSIEDRKQYDDAIAAITDKKKLKVFKAKHEDRNRSSMSKWVQSAWDYGDALIKQKKEKVSA
jgi:hypothetical protein